MAISFLPWPPDIYSLREHAGVEGSFQMNLKKIVKLRTYQENR
jgi:hypothetical protein